MDFLRTNYGEIMGYLRGKYGVNVEALDNQNNQRGIYILLLIDCFPSITKDEMSIILNCFISSIEKSMQKVRKHVVIVRKGSDKTGIWSINK